MRPNTLVTLVIGACLALNTALAVGERVRITNGEWPPFTSERLPHHGPLSRVVVEAFALEGITVDYGFFPWKRAYQHARTGKWDGTIGWAPTPEHLADFHMSEPLMVLDKALFHLKSTPFDWTTIEDLSRWRLGGTAGYSYGKEWDLAVREGRLKVEEVPLDEQNIRKLLLRRIDVAAMELDVARYLMATQLSPQEADLLTYHPRFIMQTPICLGLSRQSEESPARLARFNRGLQRLRHSGRYEVYMGDLHPRMEH